MEPPHSASNTQARLQREPLPPKNGGQFRIKFESWRNSPILSRTQKNAITNGIYSNEIKTLLGEVKYGFRYVNYNSYWLRGQNFMKPSA